MYAGAALPGREVGGVQYVSVAENYHGKVFCDCISELRPHQKAQTTEVTLYNFHQGQEVRIKAHYCSRSFQWEGICALYIRITPTSETCTYELTVTFPKGYGWPGSQE